MPIEAIYHVTHIPGNQSEEQDLPHAVFRWRHELLPTYIRNVLQLFQHRLIDDHFRKESIEVNVATKLLREALMKAADCMSFSCRPKKQIANKTWFDYECFNLKKRFK